MDAGATATKFQAFSPKEVVDENHPDRSYLEEISFSDSEWTRIISESSDAGLDVWVDVSGPFSVSLVEANEEIVTGVKVAPHRMNDPQFLEAIRRLDVSVALNCGATPLIDLFEAADRLGNPRDLVLMHGYQSFPKDPDAPGGPPEDGIDINELELWRVGQLDRFFPRSRTGLADHLPGDDPLAVQAPALGIARGATVVEKHITLDRSARREDYYSALEPDRFREMTRRVRDAWNALGENTRKIGSKEFGYKQEMKGTVRSTSDLQAGTSIDPDEIEVTRGDGWQPSVRPHRATGRKLTESVEEGEVVTNADLDLDVGICCNARLASSRLPEKATLPFHGSRSSLEYLLQRLKDYPTDLGEIALATTRQPEDDALQKTAEGLGIPCYRGPEEDVMGRLVETAEAFGWDVLVRVTGDDQFVSCEHLEKGLEHHREECLDRTVLTGLPVGMGAEIYDVKTLSRIHEAAVNCSQTEHLTWYVDSDWRCRNQTLRFREGEDLEQYRLTLDYREDLKLMREVARRGHDEHGPGYLPADLVIDTLLDLDPEWKHDPGLWTVERPDINTDLRYALSGG